MSHMLKSTLTRARGAGMLLFASLFTMAAASAGEYLPLYPGNSWTYQSTSTGEVQRISVGMQPLYLQSGQIYYKLDGYALQPLWVRYGSDGVLYWLNEEYLREEILTDFRPFNGGYYDTPISDPTCEQGGQAQERAVEVRLGGVPYPEGREIRYITYNCADTGIASEVFVESIGLAQRVIHTIAGPRTFRLVNAKVGPLSFYEEPHTAFRVSIPETLVTVGRSTGPLQTNVTLSLETDRASAVTVTYPTSQRYDVRIRNQQGETVYLWSSAAVFLPVETQEKVASLRYTVPVTADLAPGSYTIDAWLTTADPERQFAGSVPLDVITEVPVPAGRQGVIR